MRHNPDPHACLQVLSAAVREAQLPGAGPTSREPTAAVPAGAAYRMDENITVFVVRIGGLAAGCSMTCMRALD